MLPKKLHLRIYSEYMENWGRLQSLIEEVVHVEKYTKLIHSILKDNRHYIISDSNTDNEKLEYLKNLLLPYKIKIEILEETSKKYGWIKGKCNKENITIYAGNDIKDFFDNAEIYQECRRVLLSLISHELVHRGQYYIRKADFLHFYAFETNMDKKYYSNPQEIMAYAWMGIENMRANGYLDDQILTKIKNDNVYPAEMGFAYLYISDIKEADLNTYHKFLKYMYMYLKNPVKYYLKIEV